MSNSNKFGEAGYNSITLKYGIGYGSNINFLTQNYELWHIAGLYFQLNNTQTLKSYSSK
ncbi:hypothetical protein [Shewanella fodinae]|uniref:hypothetical protein n=1 Tax=Shewanella fodinae TaxID=552357 RepID=UPI001677F620|nr:hypothetical protein [Shewanella fodinae]MCL2906777.1 hypothetical protein [Shewanella fodinae]